MGSTGCSHRAQLPCELAERALGNRGLAAGCARSTSKTPTGVRGLGEKPRKRQIPLVIQREHQTGRQGLALLTRLECNGQSQLTASLNSKDPLASASQGSPRIARTIDMHHQACLDLFLLLLFCRHRVWSSSAGWSQTPDLKRSSHFGLPKLA
ncbi:hypothetical protein AAY473_015556 [Plecturocebus cupreus]